MIVILGCSWIDIEISDTNMETMKSNDCREVIEADGDANDVLVVIWEEAKFSCKCEWKFINLVIQLISRLCQMS